MRLRLAFATSVGLCLSYGAVAHALSVTAKLNQPSAIESPVEFSASAVGNGEISYRWDFGDGTKTEFSPTPQTTHSYQAPGHYPVIVVAKDSSGVRSDSFLQTIHRPLAETAPLSSSTIVYDRERNRVCNVNADANTISCIDTQSLALSFEAPVGQHPRTLAVHPNGELWVANENDATLSVLSETGAPLATINLPYGSRPFGIIIPSAGTRAFVTLAGTGELAEIDTEKRELSRKVYVAPMASGVAADGASARLLVTRFISPQDKGEVFAIDGASFEVAETITLSPDPGPDTEANSRGIPNYIRNVVISPDQVFAWVPSKKDNTVRGAFRDGQALSFETSVRTIVSLIDLSTRREVLERRIDLNNRGLGLSATFSPLGDYVFVALLGNNGLEVLDAYNGTIVSGLFNLANAPDGLVLDDQGRLFLNAFLGRSVVVLDASDIIQSLDFALKPLAEIRTVSQELLAPEVLHGKRVFYDASDERMGRDGYISCASCHLDGFEDGRIWDFTDRGEGLRNTSSLLARRGIGQGPLHWSANFDEVQDFEHDMRSAFGGKGFISEAEFQTGTRNTTLGDPKAGLSLDLDAMAAFVSSLTLANPSPYRNSDGTLTEAGFRGRGIFLNAGCADCHTGPDFSDSASRTLHDVGTLSPASGNRLGETLTGIDTPTLRGIWQTAPYLHDGSAETLWDVISHKNLSDRHGRTSTLSEADKNDLVSYLLQIDNTALEDEKPPHSATSESQAKENCGCQTPGRNVSHASLSLFFALALLHFRKRAAKRRGSASPASEQ